MTRCATRAVLIDGAGWQATLQQHPDATRSCGRLALAFLWTAVKSSPAPAPLTKPGREDRTLGELGALASQMGLDVDLIVAPPDVSPVVPSIVHLGMGHYSVVVRTDGERYLLRDPAFGGEVWMTAAALARERSGYALVPRGRSPSPSRAVTAEEARGFRGDSVCPVGPPEPDVRAD